MNFATPGPELADAFARQQQACEDLGSPFTALICRLFAERGLPQGPVRDVLFGWQGDLTAVGDAVPLRLCAALHELTIRGKAPDLANLYPPHHGEPDHTRLHERLAAAITQHTTHICQRLTRAPQTNVIGRASALYAGLKYIAQSCDLPIVVSELGASAGLNLQLDHYHYQLGEQTCGMQSSDVGLNPEWHGEQAPIAEPVVAERAGCDLYPFDLTQDQEQSRLLSYIWADQTERLEATRTALSIRARSSGNVDVGDAATWLEDRLSFTRKDQAHVIMHSIAWQYFSDADKQKARSVIHQAARGSTTSAPVFLLGMEADGKHPGCALTLSCWPQYIMLELARVDFHGRWIHWQPQADK